MGYNQVPAPSGRFVARIPAPGNVSIAVPTARCNCCLRRHVIRFVSCCIFRTARPPKRPRLLLQMPPSLPLPQRALHRELTPLRSLIRCPRLPWRCCPPKAFPPGRVDEQPQLQAQTDNCGNYGFGPVGAPRPPARQFNTPLRAPRPQPPLPVVSAPAPSPSPVPTVPISSDCDRAELVRTRLLRRPSPLAPRPSQRPTSTLLALVLNLGLVIPPHVCRPPIGSGSKQPGPTRQAAMRYIILGRPLALPNDRYIVFTLAPAPFPLQEVQDLAGKGRLLSTNASIVLFARKPTLPSLCWLTATSVTLDLLSERRVFLHVRAASYAPLGYAGLPSNGLLLRGRYAHPSNARTLSLVDWHGHLHPVVDSQLSQVPSTKNLPLPVRYPISLIHCQRGVASLSAQIFFALFRPRLRATP